jgi:hypothetical protein
MSIRLRALKKEIDKTIEYIESDKNKELVEIRYLFYDQTKK